MEHKLPDISLPVWMNKGEPLTLAHASKTWWERVRDWLMFPLAQIDVDTCDEQLLALLAYQRDVERLPGESLSLFRLRVKHAFVNAQDAGSLAGFARIFERLGVGEVQQLERQLQYDWDVILLRINDEQLSRDNVLLMHLVRQYGRTCRRYFFDVLNQDRVTTYTGDFGCLTCFDYARLIPRPTQINTVPDTLLLATGDTRFVAVGVFPHTAADLSWRADVSPAGMASVQVVEGGLLVTGEAQGETSITITANDNGITSVIPVTVVAVSEFVIQINNLKAPLFTILTGSRDFTIDYGDGTDSRDYSISSFGDVVSARPLPAGPCSVRVKGNVAVSFYRTGITFNPLIDVISLSGNRTSMNQVFRDCRSLTTVREGAFDNLHDVTTWNAAFMGCTGLAAIPETLFASARYVTTFKDVFKGCTKLSGIPSGLFDNAPGATSFDGAFNGCSAVKAIPADLFRHCPDASSFGSVFSGMKGVRTLPEGVFNGAVAGKNFSAVFADCSQLESLPQALFAQAAGAENFAAAFSGCASLTSVPDDLFSRASSATTFATAFSGCVSLGAIPAGLFDNTPQALTFHSAFLRCASLVSIPAGLFDHTPKARNFGYAFSSTGITAIPAGLFARTPEADSFRAIFSICRQLKAVPEGLFDAAENATDFSHVFSGAEQLVLVPAGLFARHGAVTTLQAAFSGCVALTAGINDLFPRTSCPLVKDVASVFYRCGLVTGSGLTFIGKFTPTAAHGGALEGCESLSDYDVLPQEWVTK